MRAKPLERRTQSRPTHAASARPKENVQLLKGCYVTKYLFTEPPVPPPRRREGGRGGGGTLQGEKTVSHETTQTQCIDLCHLQCHKHCHNNGRREPRDKGGGRNKGRVGPPNGPRPPPPTFFEQDGACTKERKVQLLTTYLAIYINMYTQADHAQLFLFSPLFTTRGREAVCRIHPDNNVVVVYT